MSIIATVDEDPIFDQLLVTLMRVVKPSEVAEAYSSVAESLYTDWLIKPAQICYVGATASVRVLSYARLLSYHARLARQ